MSKITKREYERKMKELLKIQEDLIQKEKSFVFDQDNGKVISSEEWNKVYDDQWDNEKAMKNLESEWDTRKWSVVDYSSFSLIQSNID